MTNFIIVIEVLAIICVFASYSLTVYSEHEKGPQSFSAWWRSQRAELVSRPVIVGFLISLAAIFALVGLAVAGFLGRDKLLGYIIFAAGSASIVFSPAGFIAKNREKKDPTKEVDFTFNLLGAVFLVVAFAAYLIQTDSRQVNQVFWILVAAACLAPLIIRRSWGKPFENWADRLAATSIGLNGLLFVLALLICFNVIS